MTVSSIAGIRIFLFTHKLHKVTSHSATEMSTRAKGGRCVGLTILPASCADCLEFPGASTS